MAQLTLITSTMNYAEYQCSGEVGIIEIENMHMNGLEYVGGDASQGIILVKLTYQGNAPYSLVV